MRLLITSPIFPPDLGGPATYVPSLAGWLVRRGHSVVVVAFCSDPAPAGWPFRVVSIPRGWMPLRYLRDFLAVWREARDADLVYVNEHLAFHVVLAARMRGKPVVIRTYVDGTWEISHRLGWHADGIVEYQRRDYGWRVRWLRRLQRTWWGWARRLVVPSRFMEGIVSGHGVPPQKLVLIPNNYHGPVDYAPTRAQCRGRLGLPDGRVVLLSICRLMVWKGVDGLIRALTRLPDDHHLYVAGDGDELESWTALAERLGVAGRTHFLGNVPYDELHAWIRAADVFLLNSSYEGLSHTLIEVLWLGLPAAVSAVCSNPELITDGWNGRTFVHQDVEAIAGAVREVVERPEVARLYAERGRERAREYAAEVLFPKKERLFLSVIGTDPPSNGAESTSVPADTSS